MGFASAGIQVESAATRIKRAALMSAGCIEAATKRAASIVGIRVFCMMMMMMMMMMMIRPVGWVGRSGNLLQSVAIWRCEWGEWGEWGESGQQVFEFHGSGRVGSGRVTLTLTTFARGGLT